MIAFFANNGKVSFGAKVMKVPPCLGKSRMVRSMAYADGISRVCKIDANRKPGVASVESYPTWRNMEDYCLLIQKGDAAVMR